MTPEFAAAFDPVFQHVLGVLDRISRNESLSATDVRRSILDRLRQTDDHSAAHEEWDLARFAVVAWIDEMLVEAPWDGRQWWKENVLTFELFRTRERATLFFARAKQALATPGRDALEVFYVCVVLGFRGMYRDPASQSSAGELDLPPDLDSWARQTARSIQLGQGRPAIHDTPRAPGEAQPLTGKRELLAASVVCAVLATLTAVLGWLLFR
jgi:type VI secretion system protein ImpK